MCAKVSGPLMSVDATGQFGKTLVFAKIKGRNICRQLVIPANPRSVGQQAVRAKLGSSGRMNSYVEDGSEAQLAFNAIAPSGLSGVGYFGREQISRFTGSDTDYNDVGNATIKGNFDSAAAALGLLDVTIPGDTPLVIPAGQTLWNGYESAYQLDPTMAPTPAITATAANITTFTDNLAA